MPRNGAGWDAPVLGATLGLSLVTRSDCVELIGFEPTTPCLQTMRTLSVGVRTGTGTSGFCPVEFAVVRPGAWRLAPTLAGPHLGHSLVAGRATAAVRRPYPKVGSEGLLSRLGSLLGLDSTG